MNKAVFLDRDGVINEVMTSRVRFVNRPEDFYLLDGVKEAIDLFDQLGYKIFVVTNQGGIGVGHLKEKTLHDIHSKMQQFLDHKIDDIMYCPHKPSDQCSCRKPKPGMILVLAKKHQIDLSKSFMIGDQETDIEAGVSAGVKTILIGDQSVKADYVCRNLLEAATWILKQLEY